MAFLRWLPIATIVFYCASAAVNVCRLDKAKGNCSKSVSSFYYDRWNNVCKQFIWYGCAGNLNRFSSKKTCENRCKKQANGKPISPRPIDSSSAVCTLPYVRGPCKTYQQKYFYNTVTKKCQPFFYGGCGGNLNRFGSLLECQEECDRAKMPIAVYPNKPIQSASPVAAVSSFKPMAKCFLPLNLGSGNRQEPWYYYNKDKKECDPFKYKGSGGNNNRFRYLHVCKTSCVGDVAIAVYPNKPIQSASPVAAVSSFKPMAKCFLPLNLGSGNRQEPWYYYNKYKKECDPFKYKGSGGNNNRFRYLHVCKTSCVGDVASPVEVISSFKPMAKCFLPLNLGSGNRQERWYYYNKDKKQCVPFKYKGSGGNNNRFRYLHVCRTTCVGHAS